MTLRDTLRRSLALYLFALACKIMPATAVESLALQAAAGVYRELTEQHERQRATVTQ